MKRSGLLAVIAAALFLAALTLYIRPSYASREAGQDGPPAGEAIAPAAVSATSPLFSYQGELRNAAGNPVTNAALPMTFRLFGALTGGAACWSESQNVNVQNGQFNVLLGQTTAIPAACVTGNAYLELVINGETLTPREVLTAVASAVKADTLTSGATTQGPLTVAGNLTTSGELTVEGNVVRSSPGAYSLILDNPTGGSVRLVSGENLLFFLDADNNSEGAVFSIYRNSNHIGGAVEEVTTLNEGGTLWTRGEVHAGGSSVCNGNGTCLAGTDVRMAGEYALHVQAEAKRLHLLPFANSVFDQVCIGCGTTGRGLLVRGGLEVHGGCTQVANGVDGALTDSANCEPGSITSGAYVEANLMTPAERAAETVERFERGDLLCWSADEQQLRLCTQENDRLVMAVAGADGKPIVLGAEPVKVIGPVVAGDLLVASGTPGHAMVNNDPLPGTVIGQALEDLDGESGVIKAMVRKW